MEDLGKGRVQKNRVYNAVLAKKDPAHLFQIKEKAQERIQKNCDEPQGESTEKERAWKTGRF